MPAVRSSLDARGRCHPLRVGIARRRSAESLPRRRRHPVRSRSVPRRSHRSALGGPTAQRSRFRHERWITGPTDRSAGRWSACRSTRAPAGAGRRDRRRFCRSGRRPRAASECARHGRRRGHRQVARDAGERTTTGHARLGTLSALVVDADAGALVTAHDGSQAHVTIGHVAIEDRDRSGPWSDSTERSRMATTHC